MRMGKGEVMALETSLRSSRPRTEEFKGTAAEACGHLGAAWQWRSDVEAVARVLDELVVDFNRTSFFEECGYDE